jgi:Taurine catabolism dioxygenase TauD, TfdA family
VHREACEICSEAPMNISIKNLDAPLGAEIASVDLSKPLSQDDVETIEETWRERLVVVFRGQRLSDPQLLAFSRNFGELDPPGPNPYGEPFNKQHPEINVISNVIENGKPIVSGIRSIICIRLRPRSLMSSDSEPTASSGDWALDRLSSGGKYYEMYFLADVLPHVQP